MTKSKLAALVEKVTVQELLDEVFVRAVYETRHGRAYYLDRRRHILFRNAVANNGSDGGLTVKQFIDKHPDGYVRAGEKSRQWFAEYLTMFGLGNGTTAAPLSPEANAVLVVLKKN